MSQAPETFAAPSSLSDVEREARVPLYVPVYLEPSLGLCWAVNLSPSGIGLVAAGGPGVQWPQEGARVNMRFELPDGEGPLATGAEVMWSEADRATSVERGRVAMGLRFVDLHGAERLRIGRYFQAYRPHVAVVGAVEEAWLHIAESLEGAAHLHHAMHGEDLQEILERGDISAVVIAGEDPVAGAYWAGQVAAHVQPAAVGGEVPSRDLAPRVVWAAKAEPARLVELFNRTEIFAVVHRPFQGEALREAVLRACGDYGVRTEQHRVGIALARALQRERARHRSPERLAEVQRGAIFASPAMRHVMQQAQTVAPHRVGVLVQGETGAGKEVVARLIHDLSDRADAAFVAQDCGALTETLLESELFGHVKGAFTGATSTHPGLFVMADGGTILLDEIENTSPNLQAKLLRVLETGEVRPVGGSKVRRVDVRIIAASNNDLHGLMESGKFRADLFFRLSIFPIQLPPLRERHEDIVPLAEYFRALAERNLGRSTAGFSAEAVASMHAYRWPGNVRELRNAVERAVLLTPDGELVSMNLQQRPTSTLNTTLGGAAAADPGSTLPLKARLEVVEREIIRRALEEHGGVVRQAALALGTTPMTLGRKVKKYALG